MALVQIEGLEVDVKHSDLSLGKKIGLAGLAIGLLFLLVNLTGIGGDVPFLRAVLASRGN